jgi:hypothetical protein
LLTIILAALSPFYITYAQEVRSYAMLTCLALGSTLALWQIISGQRDKRWLILYIVLTAACLYTHYFTIFLLLFQNLIWLGLIGYDLSERKNGLVTLITLWLGSQIGIFLLFLPQLRLALRQVTTYTNPNLLPPSLAYFLSRSWQAYTVGLTFDPSPAHWGMVGILGVLVIGNLLLVICYRSTVKRRLFVVYGFLLAWFIIPLAAYFIGLQQQPSFEPRYLAFVTPARFLLLALSLSHVLRPTYYVLRFTFYALPLLIFTFSLHSYYTDETYFKGDSAGVAHWLATQTTPNDIVYVDVPHPFHYYVERSHIPAPTSYLFVDIHTAAARLQQEAAGRDRLYWVTWWGSDTDPREVIPFLAEKAGNFAGQRDFRGYHVEWFNLSPTAQFDLPTTLQPVAATFGEVVRLDGLAYGETTTPGNPSWVTLHYTLLRETEVNYKASLRLRNASGQIVAQLDRDLLNDRHFRTAAWPLSDPTLNQALNVYTLPIPPETVPGSYQLELVIYNAEPPYPSEGVSGLPSDDGVSAILGKIAITL